MSLPKQSSLLSFLSFILIIISIQAFGQTQLEFAAGSYATPPNGPLLTNQTASLLENTSGTTFVATTPAVTVTASFSNQQYTGLTGIGVTRGMSFGGTVTAPGSGKTITSLPVFSPLNSIGSPSNGLFTSSAAALSASGIAVNTNYSFEIFNTVEPLYSTSATLNGRYYYGDLTITFNFPVTDPVIHFSGLGGSTTSGTAHGYSTELELQTLGVTATKLSGSSELTVSSNKILNNASAISSACGSGAACGSVKMTGIAITSLVLRVYMRGDNNGAAWSVANGHAGDAFMLSVSVDKTVTPLPVTIRSFNLEKQNNDVLVSWLVEKEKNVASYEVEHSTDGISFQPIAFVLAMQQPYYSWLHQAPSAGNHYYRLKATDLDGSLTYSSIKFIKLGQAVATINLYPNPLVNELNIQFEESAIGKSARISVYNQQGILQRSVAVSSVQGVETLSMAGLPSGLYSVNVQSVSGSSIKHIEKIN